MSDQQEGKKKPNKKYQGMNNNILRGYGSRFRQMDNHFPHASIQEQFSGCIPLFKSLFTTSSQVRFSRSCLSLHYCCPLRSCYAPVHDLDTWIADFQGLLSMDNSMLAFHPFKSLFYHHLPCQVQLTLPLIKKLVPASHYIIVIP